MAMTKRKPQAQPAPAPVPAPPSDPGRVWERMIRKLADETGTNSEHLFAEWSERAAIIEYLGELDVQVANARAYDLVRERLFPQMPLPMPGDEKEAADMRVPEPLPAGGVKARRSVDDAEAKIMERYK